jgi:hypothetical protein
MGWPGNTGVRLLKSAYQKGEEKDEMGDTLAQAEQVLVAPNVKLAHDLGYELCKCTFPPQIMLWNEEMGATVCNRCGHAPARFAQMTIRCVNL